MSDLPNKVIVDLAALGHNLNQIKSLVDPAVRIMGVVKSDAYGHGMVTVSRELERQGIYCLGVSHIPEALQLRESGIRIPIVVLSGLRSRMEAEVALNHDFIPMVFDTEMAHILAHIGLESRRTADIQIKVDTGMGRLGIPLTGLRDFLNMIRDLQGVRLVALSSHLSSADEPEREFTGIQIHRFEEALRIAYEMGFHLTHNNLANSAGILSYKGSHFHMVRPGITLYGGLPSPRFPSSVALRPVMHFKGQVLQIRKYEDHQPISYGRTYHTRGPRRIAVLSAGYGDGLPRSLSNRGMILIGGRRAAIVGRVCMNMVMCDITGIHGVASGDEVVFLGTQGNETISGDQVAGWSDTISYDIFCSIGQRNTKEYVL